MATATVAATWTERGYACMSVRVPNDTSLTGTGAQTLTVEYVGRVLMDDAWNAMTNAEKKTALTAACKAVRDAQVTPAAAAPSITGTVTV